jgi:hypothetical protein
VSSSAGRKDILPAFKPPLQRSDPSLAKKSKPAAVRGAPAGGATGW